MGKYRICQWIAGEPGEDDACKCGRPAAPGSAYCARHRVRAILSPDMWALLKIGLGSYVMGRSAEKAVRMWKSGSN